MKAASSTVIQALLLAFCGKGGVGKTTTAVATAVHLASTGKRVCVLDTDRGHSVPRALGMDKNLVPINTLVNAAPNLDIVVIDEEAFVNVIEAIKVRGWTMDQYLAQFPEDRGLIAWGDMLNSFFGAPADIATVEKFVVLVSFLLDLEGKGYDCIIIDVEPTGGLERLLSGADRMVNSLLNLSKQKKFLLDLIGVKMREIKAYLLGDYIKRAPYFTKRIRQAVGMIRATGFLFVCTPEEEPVEQTFDVSNLIRGFGGTPMGCIVNRVEHMPYEEAVLHGLDEHRIPILRTARRNGLHGTREAKRAALVEMGKEVCEFYRF